MTLAAVAAVAAALVGAGTPAPAPRGAPVVVAVVVDQLAGWIADERLPLLPADGGFARLRREGTWVRELRFLHALTETAPGHAALFTGRTPREHGIVANGVVRDDLPGAPVASLLLDPATTLTGAGAAAPGISLARLDGDTLADALLARDPAAVVVSLSFKDRGVAFGAGRRPRWAAWLAEDGRGGVALVSSSAFPPLPAWLTARAPGAGPRAPWRPRDPRWLARHASSPDDQPGEDPGVHGGRTFPHAVAGFLAYRASPLPNDLLVDLALEAVRRERDPAHPLLVTLSLSALDYVGHAYGPDSWEHWDTLLRIDAALARLLEGLDREVGRGGHTVVLAADHGVSRLPEVQAGHPPAACAKGAPDRWERPCAAGGRVPDGDLGARLDAAVARALGAPPGPAGRFVARFVDPHVVLGPEAHAALPGARAALEGALREEARRLPGVMEIVPVAAGACPGPEDEGVAALVCRSTRPGVAGAYLVAGPGCTLGEYGSGTGHGSPWLYDRAVPLLVAGPGVTRGRVVERGRFGSYRATLWWALTGEVVEGPYGGVVR